MLASQLTSVHSLLTTTCIVRMYKSSTKLNSLGLFFINFSSQIFSRLDDRRFCTSLKKTVLFLFAG